MLVIVRKWTAFNIIIVVSKSIVTLTMDVDVHTSKFRNSIPYTLLPVSPSLAALHTRRTPRKDTELVTENCTRCGFYLFAGDSSTRVIRNNAKRRRADGADVRSSNSKTTRARQTTCFQCGWVSVSPLERGSASLFPRRKRSDSTSQPSNITMDAKSPEQRSIAEAVISFPMDHESRALLPKAESHELSPAPTSHMSTMDGPSAKGVVTSTTPRSKSRPKKKTGLQEMLAHNRAKEEKARNASNATAGRSGLSAFLDSLWTSSSICIVSN